jgi:murein DD-endopeptidase MepM/ murein hydrolase activator NlpD
MGKKMETTNVNKTSVIALSLIAVCFSALSVGVAYFAYEARRQKTENVQLESQVDMVRDYLAKMEDSMISMQNYRSSIEDLTRTPLIENGKDEKALEASVGRFINSYTARASLENRDRPVSQRLATLKDNTVRMEHTLRVLNTVLGHSKDFLEAIPSITPADGWITSHYGRRVSPFSGKQVRHMGLDIGAREGTPVSVTADGKIIFAGKSRTYGNIVIVEHAFNVQTRYAHNSKLLVRRGQKVKRGQKIALVGNTGRSTGPHLHYEVWVNNQPVDPSNYLIDRIQDTTIAKGRLTSLSQAQMGGEIADDTINFAADTAIAGTTETKIASSSFDLNKSIKEIKLFDWNKTASVSFIVFGMILFTMLFGYLLIFKARRDLIDAKSAMMRAQSRHKINLKA